MLSFIIFLLSSVVAFGVSCESARTVIASVTPTDIAVSERVSSENDVFATFSGGGFQFYRNENFGVFTTVPLTGWSGSSPSRGSHIADIDSDGFLDIVGGEPNGLSLFINIGNGTFNDPINISDNSAYAIDSGDFDLDGNIDIVVSDSATIRIFENDGLLNFTAHTYGDISSARYVKAIDFDKDGDIDIVGSGYQSDTIGWFENKGSFNFVYRIINDDVEQPFRIGIGDIDGDGDYDIATKKNGVGGTATNESLLILINNGLFSFTELEIDRDSGSATTVIIKDITGDGLSDIIADDIDNGEIITYIAVGELQFSKVNITEDTTATVDLKVVDVTGDSILDIIYGDTARTEVAYIDGALCTPLATSVFLTCDYPTIICDDFDYDLPIISNIATETAPNWIPYIGGFEIGSSVESELSPIDNKLKLIESYIQSPFHSIGTFDTYYLTEEGEVWEKTFYSPVFSSEFEINISVGSCMRYLTEDLTGRDVYDIRLCSNGSILYDDGTEIKSVCSGCMTTGDNDIKITTYLSNKPNFPFNSTVLSDYISISVNDALAGGIDDFIDSDSENVARYFIIKDETDTFVIDNYYVMVGEDKDSDTSRVWFRNLYDNETVIGSNLPEGDFSKSVDDLWDTIGLRSTKSRIMFALLMMFLIALALVSTFLSKGVTPSPMILIVVEVLVLLIFTYTGLLPIWILFIFLILGAGVGALLMKMAASS